MSGIFSDSCIEDRIIYLGINVNSFTHNCGCVVDGSNTVVVIGVLLLNFIIYIRFISVIIFLQLKMVQSMAI